MDKEERFKEQLRADGQRITSTRLVTFRTLLRKTPLSTVKLAALLQNSGINQATTYRNLQLLRRLGVIQDIVTGGQRLIELSEDFGSHHHHFWCTRCGQLQDFDNPEVDQVIERLAGQLRIQVQSHQLELSGVCAGCLTK